ncbi:MAG: hypothetical protein GXO32_05130 [Crenarchaeota archaeon]|nr:hypothetical protein [Thermoproteota archaeon]
MGSTLSLKPGCKTTVKILRKFDRLWIEEDIESWADEKQVIDAIHDDMEIGILDVPKTLQKGWARQRIVMMWLGGEITSCALIAAIQQMGSEKPLIEYFKELEWRLWKDYAEEIIELERVADHVMSASMPSDDWRDRYCAFANDPC